MIDFFSRKGGKPFLVLDIEDDSIKSLILRREGKKLSILANALLGYNESDIKESIFQSVEQVFKNYANHSRGWKGYPLLLGLPSSILRARTASFNFIRENNSEISELEEKNILSKVLSDTKRKIEKEFVLDSGIMPRDIKWINFKTLERKIDGYPVSRLSGFNGKEVEVQLLGTFLPEDEFRGVKLIIDNLGLKIVKIAHIAEATLESDNKVVYPQDLKNIVSLTEDLKGPFIPTLLLSYYAKEVF